MMDGIERISQENKCNKNKVGGILEQAELVARGVLESVQAIEGAKNCKGVKVK